MNPGQEYCLECGLRLSGPGGFVGGLANAWRGRFGRYPGDWIWAVLLAFVVALIGGAIAVVVAHAGGTSGTLIATHPGTPSQPAAQTPTATVALPTVPSGTPTSTGPPPTPTTPPPARTTPSRNGLTQWPANRTGWTVVLESIPTSSGRGLAADRARAALSAGLPQVGVLVSGRYSSLHPGYYVVFSGIYGSQAQANSAAASASGKGFTAAYSRQITH